MQGEVSDEDDELGKCTTDLGARALEQVLREPVGVRKQNIVCKPIAYILTVSQQDAEGVIPGGRTSRIFKEGKNREKTRKKGMHSEAEGAYQSLAGPRTTFLV